MFSNFRGIGIAPMACMLALNDDSEKLMSDALHIYEMLKHEFASSQYLPLVSMIIAQLAEESQYENVVQKTKMIYDLMRKEHPFLTSSEDGPFAALLAFAKGSPEVIIKEVEKCYEILKPKFFSSNTVQSLSHVLALGEGSAEEKCKKVEALFEGLKARDYEYGTGYELAILGALSIQSQDMSQIVQEVTEVADYLKSQKGYGFCGVSKNQRLRHASMLVCKAYGNRESGQIMNSTVISGAIAMIVAEQVVLCVALAATTAASSSSN